MAPFALIAPVIGPALDRVQHGRRWTMAGTAIGRAILALIMAGHPTDLLVLYPCALGSLVLSKAYAVVRAAAAPRLVPQGMTLTEANARLTIFGLGLDAGPRRRRRRGHQGQRLVQPGAVPHRDRLRRVRVLLLPAAARRSTPRTPRGGIRRSRPVRRDRTGSPPLARIQGWAKRGFDDHLVIALQGESALRLLSGLLTIYLAFFVESTAHGLEAAIQLGAVVGAAGVGNFSGTAIGTKIKLPASGSRDRDLGRSSRRSTSLVVALAFSITFAVIGMYLCAVGNALSKIALDALIQRDVVETLRSSAFARSETFLQLAWVVGAAIGVALPSNTYGEGQIGFWVAGVDHGRGRRRDHAAAPGDQRALRRRPPSCTIPASR